MDLWEYSIKKSEDNLNIAKMLIQTTEKRWISISAFHAQQSVELAIKALALKHGFERYFKKKPYFKTSHIPARGLTSEIYDYVINSLKNIDRTPFGNEMNDSIDEALLKVEKIKKFFDEIEEKKNGEKFESVWLYSMGINSSDTIITALESYKKTFEIELAKKLCDGILEITKKSVKEMENFCRKNHQGFKFQLVIADVKKIFPDYGISEEIIDAFLYEDEKYQKSISELINKLGTVETIDFLLNPKGFLNVFSDSRLPSKILEKWSFKKRINFIWISYLVTISPIVILLFPHVMIGRYPREIAKIGNTETIYQENSSKVNELVSESERVFERIKKILEM